MRFFYRTLAVALRGATSTAAEAGASFPSNVSPIVTVEQGVINSFVQNDTNVFLGIPFAQSTAGENRWKAPKPIDAFHGGRFDAGTYGPSCAQAMSGTKITAQSEDCLNLNIWSPLGDTKTNLPVFVYIYGGAMVTGGNSNAQWQGYNFARKDVIYVNFNYRGSIYASPNAPELQGESQKFGILDVELALEWVYNNIEGNHLLLVWRIQLTKAQPLVATSHILFWAATPPAQSMSTTTSGLTHRLF